LRILEDSLNVKTDFWEFLGILEDLLDVETDFSGFLRILWRLRPIFGNS